MKETKISQGVLNAFVLLRERGRERVATTYMCWFLLGVFWRGREEEGEVLNSFGAYRNSSKRGRERGGVLKSSSFGLFLSASGCV
jgi:hypothetical protein